MGLVDKFLKASQMADNKNFVGHKLIFRKVFYKCTDWVDTNLNRRYLILVGPRKCGKTTCLNQLKERYNNTIYLNFKTMSIDEQEEVFEGILNSKGGLYLLDEITELQFYVQWLTKLDNSVISNLTRGEVDTRRFIITGSQAYSIEFAVSVALATNADYLHTSFIDFEEWLLWKGSVTEYNQSYNPTSTDFKEYVCNSNDFTGITDNKAYIKACLDDTVRSEINNYSAIPGMVSTDMLDVETILFVLYSFLIKLHRKANIDTIRNPSNGILSTRMYNDAIKGQVKRGELEKRFNQKYQALLKYSKVKKSELQSVIVALEQMDLVTITIPIMDLSNINITQPRTLIDEDLLSKCTICVKHPMFYANMIRDLVPEINESYYEIIDQATLGSILECHLKGLYSYALGSDILYSYEYYNDNEQGEIDLVDPYTRYAYEFTVSDSHTLKHLKRVKDSWKAVLVSGQEEERTEDGIAYEYYPNTVLRLSRGTLSKSITRLRW